MTDRKKVIVNINNQDYTVVSVESEEYIKKIAKYVDENIKEMLEKNNKLSNTMATVLSAFNIADRYYKKSEKLSEIKENVLEPLRELETIKTKLKEYEEREELLKREYKIKEDSIKEESDKKIENLSTENEEMKTEIVKLKRELENLSRKNKKHENAIEIKENDLSSNQKVINDLQDKIFEYQVELMQTKKQLEESIKTLEEK